MEKIHLLLSMLPSMQKELSHTLTSLYSFMHAASTDFSDPFDWRCGEEYTVHTVTKSNFGPVAHAQ